MKYLRASLPALCLVGAAFILPAAAKYLGSAVCYSISGKDDGMAVIEQTLKEGEISVYLYGKVADIPLAEGYLVKAKDGEIGVFDKQMSPLYKIDARIEDLPEKDRRSVMSGIEIADKSSLCEIVAYMES